MISPLTHISLSQRPFLDVLSAFHTNGPYVQLLINFADPRSQLTVKNTLFLSRPLNFDHFSAVTQTLPRPSVKSHDKFLLQLQGAVILIGTVYLVIVYLLFIFYRCVNALVFYGLNYNVRNLAGNMYLNFFLLLVVDFPSTALCCYCLQR